MSKDILQPSVQPLLARLAAAPALLAFDYDGTLAPIVDQPSEAQLSARTRALLAELTRLYPCIVVSGRAQADVIRRLRGLGVREVIGNHGLEPWRRSEGASLRIRAWGEQLAGELAARAGVEIEDKVFSLAVHYRRCLDKRGALAAIRAAARRLEGARLIGGKQVVNLVPAGSPNKGTALLAARERLGLEAALYVGDDETDEDVFALTDDERLVCVRVGRRAGSKAPYHLRQQRGIDDLLSRLIELREGGSSGQAAR